MRHFSGWLIAAVLILGLGGIGYLWWQKQEAAPAPITVMPPLAQAPVVAAEPVAPASAPADYPIEAIAPLPAASTPLPPLAEEGGAVRDAMIDLLGRQQVLSFLDVSDFARRFVATADNLARGDAASRLWPVAPAPARFLAVERDDGSTFMANGNTDRYSAFVRFATSIDSAGAVALYVRMYPQLQKAYEELGYPGKQFNNRMVEVIDELLLAPEIEGPLELTLTKVKGPIKEKRPWVRYEYADPDLEARPSGQKILMRMGAKNARLLKAKLRDIRKRIGGGKVGG